MLLSQFTGVHYRGLMLHATVSTFSLLFVKDFKTSGFFAAETKQRDLQLLKSTNSKFLNCGLHNEE